MHTNTERDIERRLAELDQQKDMKDAINKGRFSFGLDEKSYGHLPAWKDLVKRRKQMVKIVWVLAFFLSMMVVSMAGDFVEQLSQNWLKAVLLLLSVSAIATVFYVIGAFYSLFIEFRKTEREVRKLIYQDILAQLKKEEKEFV